MVMRGQLRLDELSMSGWVVGHEGREGVPF